MSKDWEIRKLKDIGITQTGTTPPTKDKSNYGNYINFVKPAHFNINGTIDTSKDGLSEAGLKKGRLIEKDSVLMVCIGATIGKTALCEIPVSCNQQINSFTPNKNLCSKFFYYILSSSAFYKKVIDASSQATLPLLNKSKWESLEVSFPESLEEQKKIVKILDKTFEAIEKAKINIEKNIQNAKELFDSRLNEIFSQKGDGWEEKTIKEITTLLGDGLHGTPKYLDNGEYYFINGNNLNDGQIVFKDRTKRVSFTEYQKYKKDLTDRTVFVSINGTLGNVAFYNNEKVILGKSACYFNLIENVNKYFIKYFIKSPIFIKYAHSNATGATIKNVSLKTMRELKVNLPTENEQNLIVKKLDKLSEQTKQLEQKYQQKLNNLEELKKSILEKAFSGELLK